jgi:CheY-like chemotaxis protein
MVTDPRPILVVDDEPDVRAVIRECLETYGHAVVDAADGREAVFAVADHGPKAVLMDIVMASCGGVEAIERIRETHPGLPIVAITSYTSPLTSRWLQRLGVETLTKPFEIASLMRAVEALR